jgi:predicted TIM-barrel fold metal-dependent hydrolase
MSDVPLVDCHQHLIYPDRLPYAWTRGIPALEGRPFTVEDYGGLVAGRSVRTIFMETAPDDAHWRQEARMAMELADRPGSLIDGLVLGCRPEEEGDFDAFVESVRHPKLCGFRRVLHVVPDDVAGQPRFVENVRRLAGHGLTFDLCVLARQLPVAMKLADTCPDVRFVLDHCGVPNVAGRELDPWRSHLQELARRPNVACKISGVLAYCDPANATVEAVRPFVEHAVACFGWDRVVWGSDWPVVCMTAGLPAWLEVTDRLFAAESDASRRKLYHANAERIYLRRP